MLRAVVRLLVPLLTCLILFLPTAASADPSVQTFDASAGSATCGSVVLTWSSPAPSLSMDPQTATIHAVDAGGQTVFDFSQQELGMETMAPVWCGDLLGNGSQVVNYATFSGGAHCCYAGAVVLLDGSGRHLLDWGLGSFGPLEPQQLDGKGPLEIPAISPIFNYYDDLGFANSPTLPLVYAYDGSSYVEATAQFPGYLAPEVARAEADLSGKARTAQPLDQQAYALKVYALHLLLGDGEKALPGVKAKIGPAAASWLAAHAADIQNKMAQAYALPRMPTSATANPAAPAMVAIAPPPPSPAPAPEPATADATVQAVDSTAPAPDASDTDNGGVPDRLSDGVRADILAAVDRANGAWAKASRTLDGTVLNGNVADRELSDDLAELNNLRRLGQVRNNVNQAFAVTGVTLDGRGLATVRTHETWYAETYTSGGQLLQRTPSTTYDETYTVQFQNGGWIVTKNDI